VVCNYCTRYFLAVDFVKKEMSYIQTTTPRNRINPLTVSNVEQTAAPYVSYDDVTLCTDPNCPVCRATRRDKRHKKHHHRRHHHHHRKHKTSFWDNLVPRVESAGTIVSVHSIELDDRRPYYNTNVTERAIAPIDQTERQVVTTTTRPRRVIDDEVVREAWVRNFL
jgi:hypothetical protein